MGTAQGMSCMFGSISISCPRPSLTPPFAPFISPSSLASSLSLRVDNYSRLSVALLTLNVTLRILAHHSLGALPAGVLVHTSGANRVLVPDAARATLNEAVLRSHLCTNPDSTWDSIPFQLLRLIRPSCSRCRQGPRISPVLGWKCSHAWPRSR